MANRRYVLCKFRAGDKRAYTYHYEGDEPLHPGAEVKVPDKSGEGWSRVIVVSLSPITESPAFETKPILGLAEQSADFDPAAIAHDLGGDAGRVLEWLAKEDASAAGECQGKALDELIAKGLATNGTAHAPEYAPVFATDRGRAVLKARNAGELPL